MTPYPQAKRIARAAGGARCRRRCWSGSRTVNGELNGDGRVLVRPSGTEPVVRVLAEAPTQEEAEALCARIAVARQPESSADPSRDVAGERSHSRARLFLGRFSRVAREVRTAGCAGSSDMSGSREAKPLLLSGLRRLEYRGYDSAGIALREAAASSTFARSGTFRICRGRRAERLAHAARASGTRAGRRTAASPCRTRIRSSAATRASSRSCSTASSRTTASCANSSSRGAHVHVRDRRGSRRAHPRAGVRRRSRASARRVYPKPRRALHHRRDPPREPDLLVGVRNQTPLVVGLGDGENFLASNVAAFLE